MPPWYDRNLRIVQNLFRTLEDEEDRLLLVIGSGHVRILTAGGDPGREDRRA